MMELFLRLPGSLCLLFYVRQTCAPVRAAVKQDRMWSSAPHVRVPAASSAGGLVWDATFEAAREAALRVKVNYAVAQPTTTFDSPGTTSARAKGQLAQFKEDPSVESLFPVERTPALRCVRHGVCPTPTDSSALSAMLSFGISALNRRCLIWSHTMITAEQVLAAELEPPATGAGGKSLSPM